MSWESDEVAEQNAERSIAVIVAGNAYTVKAKSKFGETVKRLAKKEKLTRFHVYVDDVEVLDPEDAPETLEGVENNVRITAYNKAGSA